MEDDQLELCNDDGFVFKRKRRRVDAPPPPPSEPDQEAAEKFRRERKKQTLLKLKSKYEKEILQWESFSNTLRSMQQLHTTPQQQPQPNLSLSLPSTDSAGTSLLRDLLLQVEAQDAIIRDVSNLCDIAEAVCVKREEQLKQTLFDLPIWASPLELMQGLCDGDDD
ncbi:hypothetical protein AAZX31_19G002500 [Glycine max]|uniref:Uncharacterized protein n=2 Tax=Glycine subgen. Soja TaxID=1462606 RepID=I1N5L2_SOYBN|nr:uncharacterized protein LOC102664771 isoform X2 [Glycine max]XP_028217602.1 uncharacterized protein LOC114399595 isoform X2 [Glycine soja]KAG4911440.1 hypothetical protein JHK86_051873 [Glycine max]KAG4914394.1 hypothetical protein JHK87_051951 [Glycine soja]KAG4926239.1 hypothetical protein JHK85_052725 [Glycine max]KAG5081878.1 hypothetical protein JHK84_051916 [Glycine max]KAG5084639.1 hypothetical protein JHK82_052036 [Glycine max]|eukprot:XP_006603791.1 uncharacterized protein LOC102664771 isoform X2 [Glycine max]